MKKMILLSILIVSGFGAFAQMSLGFNLGMSSYEGDLHCFEEPDLNILNSAGITFGLHAKKEVSKYFSGRLAYQFARFNGDDADFSLASGHPGRNFNFVNNLHELTVRLDFEPWRTKLVSPFLSTGLGFALNNPNTFFDFENKNAALQSLIQSDQDGLTRFIFSIPVSTGVHFRLNDVLKLGLEFGLRLPMSDYLDGVSNSANSSYNDYFGTGAIVLGYNIGKQKAISTKPYTTVKADKPMDAKIESTNPAPPNVPETPAVITEETVVDEKSNSDKEIVKDEEKIIMDNSSDLNQVISSKDQTSETTPSVVKAEIVDIDSDGDGFLDKDDYCPNVYSLTNNGCPKKEVNSDVNCEAEFGDRTVNFKTSFSELSTVDKETLNSVVAILSACEDLRVVIEGHTDSVGSELVNQELSQRRANSVKSYIASRGIDVKRIKAYGFGENQPVNDNKTEAGRALNRRVVISFF